MFAACGVLSMLLSFLDPEVVEGTPGFDAVRRLRSYVSLEENVHVGDRVQKTIDLFTVTGLAVLIHSDPQVLAEDISLIRKMEVEGSLFVLQGKLAPHRSLSGSPVLGVLPSCFEFIVSLVWSLAPSAGVL